MSEEQVQLQRRTAGMKHRRRRKRLDPVEQEPVLPEDFFEGARATIRTSAPA